MVGAPPADIGARRRELSSVRNCAERVGTGHIGVERQDVLRRATAPPVASAISAPFARCLRGDIGASAARERTTVARCGARMQRDSCARLSLTSERAGAWGLPRKRNEGAARDRRRRRGGQAGDILAGVTSTMSATFCDISPVSSDRQGYRRRGEGGQHSSIAVVRAGEMTIAAAQRRRPGHFVAHPAATGAARR